MENRIINIKTNGNGADDLGYLSYFESRKDIPFEIKRLYYIYDVPLNTKRGMHAHKELQQLLWCPYGKIEVILDNGTERKLYVLDNPHKALLILRGDWREMYWKKENSVLCVAASDFYNEEDYIRDYNEFLKYVKEGYRNNED